MRPRNDIDEINIITQLRDSGTRYDCVQKGRQYLRVQSKEARLVLIDLNPLTGLIEALRWMVISGYTPSFEPIGLGIVTTLALASKGSELALETDYTE